MHSALVSAVVTVVHGRHEHLRRQRLSLAAGASRPDLHVLVAMGDPAVDAVADDGTGLATQVIHLDLDRGRLPVGAARNAGFASAAAQGARVLIGLDVDCLAGADLVSAYTAAAESGSDALLCGAVTYLPADAALDGLDAAGLAALRDPHPARPIPPAGTRSADDHSLFWSLSFAATDRTWSRIGGFDESYVGYGAEDTDFGQRAAAAGVPLVWLGGADAYHQHHPTASPPVQHVEDLLRNGRLFAERWGWWPMRGWFEDLAANGMVAAAGSGWRRPDAVRVLSLPADHPYVSAIRPAHVSPVAPDRSPGWAPDPVWTLEGLRAVIGSCDVIHVHFGYDHLTAAQMAEWVAVVRDAGVPLTVTVHDLRNPHHPSPGRHENHLEILLAAAAEVITLTPGAASAIERRYGASAAVIPHPTLLDGAPADAPTEAGLVALHLKSLRMNVLEPERVVRAVLEGARRAGGRLRLDVHDDALDDPALGFVRDRRAGPDLQVEVHARFDDAALAAYLAHAHVSVLPYRFGTHSGWLELCRDVGTRVVAPDCGFYAEQWADVVSYPSNETDGLDDEGLSDAVARALAGPPLPPADRDQRRLDRDIIRMRHARAYASALR